MLMVRKRRKSDRILPLKLQIRNFQRIFLKANADYYSDPQSGPEQFDFEGILDDGVEFSSNQRSLEQLYPDYLWRVPKKPKPSSTKPIWVKESSKTGKFNIYRVEVQIRPFKTKVPKLKMYAFGKRYYYGRIQVNVTNINLIGRIARISVKIPVKRAHKYTLLRKIRPTDFEYEHELLLPSPYKATFFFHPESVLEVKMRVRDEIELSKKIEASLNLLRLFHLGSVQQVYAEQTRKSVMWITGTTISQPITTYSAAFRYTVDESRAADLASFYTSCYKTITSGLTKSSDLNIALERYNNSLLEAVVPERRIMSALMGLEALYCLHGDRGEITYRLALRASRTLSFMGYEPLNVKGIMEKAYDIRSKTVHGSRVKVGLKVEYGVILNSVMQFLRKSLLLVLLLNNDPSKHEFISMLDNSMISENHLRELKGKIENAISGAPGKVFED